MAPLARLGTSSLCAHPVRGNRSRGRISAPALHHAPHCQSPDLGLDIRTDYPGVCNSVLGVHPRPTAAGSNIRIQSNTNAVARLKQAFALRTLVNKCAP